MIAAITPTTTARGYRMPAEWEPHAATWLTWPHDEAHWPGIFEKIPPIWARITKELIAGEDVHILIHDSKTEKILELLGSGKKLALISDAGTPAISDPGSMLVSEIRHALPEVEIIAIPGPSALTAAISIAGMATNAFVFYGFLPHKKGRETIFREITENERAAIFYESPHHRHPRKLSTKRWFNPHSRCPPKIHGRKEENWITEVSPL